MEGESVSIDTGIQETISVGIPKISTSWCTVNIISKHPRLFLNPHWDSGRDRE